MGRTKFKKKNNVINGTNFKSMASLFFELDIAIFCCLSYSLRFNRTTEKIEK